MKEIRADELLTFNHAQQLHFHAFFFLMTSIIASESFLRFPAPVIPGDASILGEESDSPRLLPKHEALWQEAPVKTPSALLYLGCAMSSTHQLLQKFLSFFQEEVDLPVKATKKKKKKQDEKWQL